MGMDVFGNEPQNKTGEYFRATIWSWPIIHALLEGLCKDLFDEQTLEYMGYNDGAGPDNQQTCDQIAQRIERWSNSDSASEALGHPDVRELVESFVRFLKSCGGFSVC